MQMKAIGVDIVLKSALPAQYPSLALLLLIFFRPLQIAFSF